MRGNLFLLIWCVLKLVLRNGYTPASLKYFENKNHQHRTTFEGVMALAINHVICQNGFFVKDSMKS